MIQLQNKHKHYSLNDSLRGTFYSCPDVTTIHHHETEAHQGPLF